MVLGQRQISCRPNATTKLPVTLEHNIAMQQLTNLSYMTRMKRDAAGLKKISSKAVAWSPFSSEYSLGDFVTGVVTDKGVNVATCTKMSPSDEKQCTK